MMPPKYTIEKTHLGKTRVVRFENFQLLESWLDHYKSHDSSTTANDERRDWSGDATFAECVRMLRHGWKPADKYNAAGLADRVRAKSGDADRYNVAFDVSGDFIDVGAFLTGEPECWGYTEVSTVPVRKVDIIVNLTASAGVSAKQMKQRGIAIAALIDNLRKRHEVTLKAVFVARGGTGTKHALAEFQIDTKRLYSPDLLYFYLAHPGFFRKVGFRVLEIAEEIYSCGMNTPAELKAGADYDPANTIYFESLHLDHKYKWADQEKIAEQMAALVRQYNEAAATQ